METGKSDQRWGRWTGIGDGNFRRGLARSGGGAGWQRWDDRPGCRAPGQIGPDGLRTREGDGDAVGNSGKEGELVLDRILGMENSGWAEREMTYPREGERILQAGGSGKESLVRVAFTGIAIGEGRSE